jgi:formate hydrogenlyase subunit 7
MNEPLVARAPSLYLLSASSCGACELELAGCFGPVWNLEKMGVNWVDHPGMADLIVLAGCMDHFDPRPILAAVPKPYWVIALGTCAQSGGMFGAGGSFVPLDERIQIDLIIPGCPPRPSGIQAGLEKLLTYIKQRKR